jgi:hypothetical protein
MSTICFRCSVCRFGPKARPGRWTHTCTGNAALCRRISPTQTIRINSVLSYEKLLNAFRIVIWGPQIEIRN